MFLRNTDARLIQQTLICVRNFSKAASAFRNHVPYNNTINYPRRKTHEDLINSALENITITTPTDWEKVKQFLFKDESRDELNQHVNPGYIAFTQENIDGMIMNTVSRTNRLDLAKSYLTYLEGNNTKPNLATVGRYLKLLYDNYSEKISKTDELEILSLCDSIQKNNPILESRTLENMVLALSLTKEWKKCIEIVKEIKRTAKVSTLAYSALISAAFLNKEEQLAWDMLHETLSFEKSPLSITYLSYLKTLKRQRKRENIMKNLQKLFQFFKETEIHCHEAVADDIVHTFSLGKKTTVKFLGQCGHCQTKLQKLELTDEEFFHLKDVFFQNAIVGKDIFIKSNPEEMRHFQEFLSNMKKYDVVLDGLNIAYSAGIHKGPQVFSAILSSVVSHFVEQNKSVLMLGRAHMKRWPHKNWSNITQNADIFLTQNISQDDPYLLYCALHSGKDTIIVTRDLMRGHKFLLKDRQYKVLFDRWLSQRQHFLLRVNENGRAFFRVPSPFSAVTQKNDNVWHIPYVPQADESINESYHKTWLCIDCK